MVTSCIILFGSWSALGKAENVCIKRQDVLRIRFAASAAATRSTDGLTDLEMTNGEC